MCVVDDLNPEPTRPDGPKYLYSRLSGFYIFLRIVIITWESIPHNST